MELRCVFSAGSLSDVSGEFKGRKRSLGKKQNYNKTGDAVTYFGPHPDPREWPGVAAYRLVGCRMPRANGNRPQPAPSANAPGKPVGGDPAARLLAWRNRLEADRRVVAERAKDASCPRREKPAASWVVFRAECSFQLPESEPPKFSVELDSTQARSWHVNALEWKQAESERLSQPRIRQGLPPVPVACSKNLRRADRWRWWRGARLGQLFSSELESIQERL